jgi:hypothetical protein
MTEQQELFYLPSYSYYFSPVSLRLSLASVFELASLSGVGFLDKHDKAVVQLDEN